MCKTCEHLKGRVTGLAGRINKVPLQHWDKHQAKLRRAAYDALLKSIESHMKRTTHYVDSLEVMVALGIRN